MPTDSAHQKKFDCEKTARVRSNISGDRKNICRSRSNKSEWIQPHNRSDAEERHHKENGRWEVLYIVGKKRAVAVGIVAAFLVSRFGKLL